MKINHSAQARRQGSVLVTTMTVLALAAIVLASYFYLVQNQAANVARSQTWNAALPVAEAGLEEALSFMNQGNTQIFLSVSNAWNWTNNVGGSSGWSAFANNQTSLTRYVSGSNYFTVTIDISTTNPVITSSGTIPYTAVPWVFSASARPLIATAGSPPWNSSGSGNIGRKIQVQPILPPLYSAAVVTKSNFNMNGNTTMVDSFDSSNPLYSTAGQYDASKHEANGSVGTDSAVIGDVSLGNGNIYGHVYTGPGSVQTSVQIGANGAVGDLAWNASSSGIEPGFWGGDFNVQIPDVPAPPTGNPVPPATNGTITLTGGVYTSASDPGATLYVTGPSLLWVQGSYAQNLTIATTNNASLALYVGTESGSGDSLNLGGNAYLNFPGYAANLQIYGLPSVTSIAFSGNENVIGTLYAPEANIAGGGGGSGVVNFAGAMIVNSITMHGHWAVHYDEALGLGGPVRGWLAQNWQELSYP